MMVTDAGQESFIREKDLRDRCPESERQIMLEAKKKSERFKPLADVFAEGTDMYEFDTKEGNLHGRTGYCIVKGCVVLAHIFVT